MPYSSPKIWEMDPLVRQAVGDLGRSWIRSVVIVVVSAFLFEFVGVLAGAIWVGVSLLVEAAGAYVRRRLRAGDLKWRPAYPAILVASSLCWVTHALMLWAQPEDVARYAALFDLFSVSLYAAVGGATDRRLILALITAPLVALFGITVTYVWTHWPLDVALFTTVATLGSCVTILVNAMLMHRTDSRLLRTAAKLDAVNTAKDAFIADVSHEIRTPLNGVVALAGALERTPLDDKQREMVALIRSSGETMRRLVSSLLDLAKIDAGHLELENRPFDLASAIETAALPMREQANEKNLAFSIEIAPGVRGAFLGDALRVGQIVANLTSNAVKFTTSGKVEVKVSAVDAEPGRTRIEIAVRDTGPGITEAMRARLFRRFSQLEGQTEIEASTGLGLSISAALAHLMGGDIDVRSEVGVGSEFIFRVTLQKVDVAAPPAAAARAAREPAGATSDLRILLADDHAVSRRAIELILQPIGASVTMAEDGRASVETFSSGAFDLILMDKRMPVLDGLAATREIRSIERAQGRPAVPILMLSADAAPTDLERASEAGCSGHVAKPVTPEALLEAIQRVLASR